MMSKKTILQNHLLSFSWLIVLSFLMQLSPTLTLSFHSRLLLSFHSSLSRPSNLCALSHSSFHCALCLMNFCEATPSQFLSQLSPSKLSVKCFFSFHVGTIVESMAPLTALCVAKATMITYII